MKWTVGVATPDDVPSLASLLRELASELGAALPGPPQLERFLEEEVRSQDRLFLLASRGAARVGACGLRIQPCLWTQRPAAEILEMVVAPDRRGQGCGTALLEAAANEARSRGCSHLWVLTEGWNGRARDFYRRLQLTEKECSYFEMGLRAPGAAQRGAGGGEAPPAPPVTAS